VSSTWSSNLSFRASRASRLSWYSGLAIRPLAVRVNFEGCPRLICTTPTQHQTAWLVGYVDGVSFDVSTSLTACLCPISKPHRRAQFPLRRDCFYRELRLLRNCHPQGYVYDEPSSSTSSVSPNSLFISSIRSLSSSSTHSSSSSVSSSSCGFR